MNAIDLFAGIGGASLGLARAGFNILAHCEQDPFCQRILHKHWPDVPCYGSVETFIEDAVDVIDKTTIDLVWGSPPCQPFSQAGTRTSTADDRHLWPHMFEIVRHIYPAWVGVENVARIDGLALDGILTDLEGASYEVQTFEIPACAVNAPHIRNRIFIVAHATGRRSRQKTVNRVFRSRGDGNLKLADPNSRQPQRIGKPGRLEKTTGALESHENQRQRSGRTLRDCRSRSGNLDNPYCTRLQGQALPKQPQILAPPGPSCSDNMAYAGGERCEKGREREGWRSADGTSHLNSNPWQYFDLAYSTIDHKYRRIPAAPKPQLCRMDDGIPTRMDGDRLMTPTLPAGHPQLANKSKRLKALGNAVIPQIVELIACAMLTKGLGK